MKMTTCIKHLSKFCDIQDYKVRNYANETGEKMATFVLNWRYSRDTFMICFDLAITTKWELMNFLAKQLGLKPKVTDADRLFFFKYLTRHQQTILYKMEPEFYGKVYKYGK